MGFTSYETKVANMPSLDPSTPPYFARSHSTRARPLLCVCAFLSIVCSFPLAVYAPSAMRALSSHVYAIFLSAHLHLATRGFPPSILKLIPPFLSPPSSVCALGGFLEDGNIYGGWVLQVSTCCPSAALCPRIPWWVFCMRLLAWQWHLIHIEMLQIFSLATMDLFSQHYSYIHYVVEV
jgi:hypothetical protein